MKKPYNGAAANVMAYDVRFLHLTLSSYVASRAAGPRDPPGETQAEAARRFWRGVGLVVRSKFALCDGVMSPRWMQAQR